MAVVYGVFDRLHDGHKSFLRQAQAYTKTEEVKRKLIVVVATDSIVDFRKGKNQDRQPQTVRCSELEK